MRKQILVVDDDPLYLELVHDIFATRNIDVLRARSVQEALSLLSSSLPSFVISDFQMPDMNGIDFHRLLCNDARLKEVPFAFVSGSTHVTLSEYARKQNVPLLRKSNIVVEILNVADRLK